MLDDADDEISAAGSQVGDDGDHGPRPQLAVGEGPRQLRQLGRASSTARPTPWSPRWNGSAPRRSSGSRCASRRSPSSRPRARSSTGLYVWYFPYVNERLRLLPSATPTSSSPTGPRCRTSEGLTYDAMHLTSSGIRLMIDTIRTRRRHLTACACTAGSDSRPERSPPYGRIPDRDVAVAVARREPTMIRIASRAAGGALTLALAVTTAVAVVPGATAGATAARTASVLVSRSRRPSTGPSPVTGSSCARARTPSS